MSPAGIDDKIWRNREGESRGGKSDRRDQPQVQDPRGLRDPFQSYELQVIGIHHPPSEAVLLPDWFRDGTVHFLLQRNERGEMG